MLYRTQFTLILIFLNLLIVNAAQGQWLPQGTNHHNPHDETLNLPSVFIILPDPNSTQTRQYLFNVRIKSQGDSIFELMSADESQPEQECSRAKVLNAIPELRLNMTIVEGNTLIGCTANIDRGPAGGKRGFWQASHEREYMVFFTIPVKLSITLSLRGRVFQDRSWWAWAVIGGLWQFLSMSSYLMHPAILAGHFLILLPLSSTLLFRRLAHPFSILRFGNVVESYRYSTGGMTDGLPRKGCADLQASFSQLNTGDTFEEIGGKLGCDGRSKMVTLSGAGEQRNYQWQYFSRLQITSDGVPVNNRLSQTVSVSFLNDVA